MTYIYKNRERHIVLILRLETGDFDFRIKQKTLSFLCRHRPFLRSVYCKDTFFVQYDALFSDYYSLLVKERYTFQNVSLLHSELNSDLFHYMAIFFIYADKPPESGTLTKKGVRTFLPLIKKQVSPNTNSETSKKQKSHAVSQLQ